MLVEKMAKRNAKAMKVDGIFFDIVKELNEKTGISRVKITEKLGQQLQVQLRDDSESYIPKLPEVKLPDFPKWRNKKASIVDVFFLMAVFFMIAVGFLVANDIWDNISDKIEPKFNTTDTGRFAIGKVDAVAGMMDNIFLIIFILSVIGIVILSMTVKFEPAFYFIFVLMILFGLVGAAIFSNAYEKLTETSNLESAAFPVQNYVMENLPVIFVIIGLAAIIIIYAKIRLAT